MSRHSRRRCGVRATLALLPLLAVGPAAAWNPAFHEAVAVQAGRLMPASLQSVLALHAGRLKEGARAPMAWRGRESQYLHAGGSYGSLDVTIRMQSQRVLDLLQSRTSMDVLAYELGVLSHLVALAEDPVHVAADDPREAEWAGQFHRFAEQRLPRFRVVFDGYLSAPLERDDVAGFARHLADRSRRHYPLLARSYVRDDGSIAAGSRFDDRHPVFGVASLAYSRSIADTAKLWLYLWIQAGGDTTDLPFPRGLSRPTVVGRARP